MAKKDTDNFDFEVEGEGKEKGKFNLNLDFIKNLTKQQKGIILAALVGIILVVAIFVICIVVGAAGGDNPGGTNNGGTADGENGGETNDPIRGEITSFYISSEPTKKIYYVDEVYDYTGLTLYIDSSEGSGTYVRYEDSPEDFTITGFNSSVPVKEQTITVVYAERTVTFTIEIREIPAAIATLVGIRLDPDNMPLATCKKGKAPDLRGAKLICDYSDGSTKVIDISYDYLYNYATELRAANVGDVVEIPVRYDENGIVKKTSFTVTIVE